MQVDVKVWTGDYQDIGNGLALARIDENGTSSHYLQVNPEDEGRSKYDFLHLLKPKYLFNLGALLSENFYNNDEIEKKNSGNYPECTSYFRRPV